MMLTVNTRINLGQDDMICIKSIEISHAHFNQGAKLLSFDWTMR